MLQFLKSPNFRKLGDFTQIMLPAVGFLSTLYNRDWRGFCNLFKSTLITSVLTHVIKFLTKNTALGRRPDGGSRSFPSGHTSSAFSAAALISRNTESPVISVAAYTLACFTGYSRISANRHHYRDVIAGATLGIFTSYYLYRSQNDDRDKPAKKIWEEKAPDALLTTTTHGLRASK